MRKLVKVAAVGACLVLTGCPKATSVTGLVTAGGSANETIVTGAMLGPATTYHVDNGASIMVSYDNGKTCTFRGPTDFVPGADGSVCENKKDNDDKKQDDDQKQDQQEQNRQDRSDASQDQGQATNGGTSTTPPGIDAPAVTPTPVPDYSGIGGPQASATAVPTFTRIMEVVNNPTLANALAIIGAAAVVKEVHDQTNGDGDEPISK